MNLIFLTCQNSDINTKLAKLATKAELKAEQNKILKFKAFNSKYFCGKSNFEDDVTQNYVVFRYLKKLLILLIFQKDCLMRVLNLLSHLLIVLLHR